MRTEVVEFLGYSITYYVWGGGPNLVLMFHGYGESGKSFNELAESFPEAYTLIALDLPFHGDSKLVSAEQGSAILNEKLHLSNEEPNVIPVEWLYGLVQIIRKREQFTDIAILLGYSMGGRICLQLYQHNPDHYARLVLIAPDGMKENFWYWFATQTAMGNKLFRFSVTRPAWFMMLVRWAGKFKMVNAGIAKYVAKFLNDEQIRMGLYIRWTAFKAFRPQIKVIRKEVLAHQTSVLFIYGKYDKIIRAAQAEKFRIGLEHLVELQIINAGHQLLQTTFAAQISSAVIATAPAVKR